MTNKTPTKPKHHDIERSLCQPGTNSDHLGTTVNLSIFLAFNPLREQDTEPNI